MYNFFYFFIFQIQKKIEVCIFQKIITSNSKQQHYEQPYVKNR